MTDTEINLAVAEVEGWSRIEFGPYDGHPFGWPPGRVNCDKFRLPNYCHDLNAIRDAVKENFDGTPVDELQLYAAQLLAVIHDVDADYFNKVTWKNAYELATATARQHAEAFLRVHGKWVNTPTQGQT